MIPAIIKTMFPEKYKLIQEGKCPECAQPIKMEEFRDHLSRAEVGISGLCQKCQDKVFGVDTQTQEKTV